MVANLVLTDGQATRLDTLWQEFLKRINAEFEKSEEREDCIYLGKNES